MMDPRSTALVLIEYQNDFTSEGGSLHAAVKPVMQATHMLDNTVRLVEAARALGVQIIFVPIQFSSDYHELSAKPYGILKGVVDTHSFRKGTWGAEIVECLTPKPQDIVIEGKRGLCGFASTNLDFILRSRGITSLGIGGFLTNCCVEATSRSAYEKGYHVVTLKDCTATVSQEEQNFAFEKNFPMFSLPASADEFLSELRASAASHTVETAAA
ncbi:isochorismatase hydrolase [Beijerinckia indica subsp. indica ATCC 9039]|uniref:Isochorismatase hydrolase n=2 Tax=Beijerinckia TaxID=532 RepID=B2IK94_BEII9|nr:isochorismatase hydrolase [Beijerinckia indica subsp. indica ATCC 9039]